MTDLTGLIVGFALTLFVYTYVWGDNPLYRVAIHLLVGVSAAYAAVIVLGQVMLPLYVDLLTDPTGVDSLMWYLPILLGLLLLLKRLPRLAWMGTATMALLVGVGAAVALIGAIRGTLWPQVVAGPAGSAAAGVLAALLTAAALLRFQFSGRTGADGSWVRPAWQRSVALVGQAVIMITFGALFASVLNTSLVLVAERVQFFIGAFGQLLS